MQSPLEILHQKNKESGKDPFLFYKKNKKWESYTWNEVKSNAEIIAGSLKKIGIKENSKIAILSENCPEWIMIDLACMIGGYISVPIYPSANSKTIKYILLNSESKAIFIGKTSKWQGKEEIFDNEIITLGMPHEVTKTNYSWYHLLNYGIHLSEYDKSISDKPATIMYTSGSSGAAKGVLHSISSLSWAAESVCKKIDLNAKDKILSYLTFAHITERIFVSWAGIYSGARIYFNDKPKNLNTNLKEIQPTIFVAIPRVLKLFKDKICLTLGNYITDKLLEIFFIKFFFRKIVLNQLGLNKIRVIGCGSAPIKKEILEWYGKLKLNVCEAWGMTENSAYSIINYPVNTSKLGSIGKLAEDCKYKIHASDQELLFYSPGLMSEYYNMPKATENAFDEEGYIYTGDIVEVDEDGYFYIKNRKNEIFKTSKGKFINPKELEELIKLDDIAESMCVIGTGLKQPALVVKTNTSKTKNIKIKITQAVEAMNNEVENHQKIKIVLLTTERWTPENGLITPTLKKKRSAIELKFIKKLEKIEEENHSEDSKNINITWEQ